MKSCLKRSDTGRFSLNKNGGNPVKEKSQSTFRIAKRVFALMVILFLLLLGGRFLYNLLAPEREMYNYGSNFANIGYEYEALGLRNNIATNKLKSIDLSAGGMAIDQKYERVANLTSKSLDFEADLALAKAALEQNGGIVQAENSHGLAGGRSAALTIGVRPEAFEALREVLSGIGEITDTNVSTVDKTSEFRQLLAEKESLERRVERYEELKKQGGSLQDQLALEAEIVKVDSDLRAKLVELGEFGDDQGLSTIHFSLYEGGRVSAAAKFVQALTWAGLTTAYIAALLLLMAFASYIAAAAWKYIRKLRAES